MLISQDIGILEIETPTNIELDKETFLVLTEYKQGRLI